MIALHVEFPLWRRLDALVDVAHGLEEVLQVVQVGGTLVAVFAANKVQEPDHDEHDSQQSVRVAHVHVHQGVGSGNEGEDEHDRAD